MICARHDADTHDFHTARRLGHHAGAFVFLHVLKCEKVEFWTCQKVEILARQKVEIHGIQELISKSCRFFVNH